MIRPELGQRGGLKSRGSYVLASYELRARAEPTTRCRLPSRQVTAGVGVGPIAAPRKVGEVPAPNQPHWQLPEDLL